MESLKQLLSILDEDSSVDSIETTFSKIADILLFKSYIKTTTGNFRILEIEFYFKNKYFEDDVTLERTANEGMWWLHDWGVDISFKSVEKKFYGGVLIRSILPLKDNNVQFNEKKVISGPRNCCWELFYASALESNMAPQIITLSEDNIFDGEREETKRYIKGQTKRVNGDYRFYVKGLKIKN